MKDKKSRRTVNITYCDDYGGKRAWLIQEYYEGQRTHDFTKVLKSEYFRDLQDVISNYLEKDFKIFITND